MPVDESQEIMIPETNASPKTTEHNHETLESVSTKEVIIDLEKL